MKKIAKIAGILAATFVVLFAVAAIYIDNLDADKYRPQLVNLLTQKTGRAVKLNGPIALSLGLGGIRISVQDASIGNPPWASRPNMAGMGKFEVGVGVIPLLAHKLEINELTIENADILLETNALGQQNWQFGPPQPVNPQTAKAAAPVKTTTASGEALSIDKLNIVNSQLAMRAADGKVSSYNVASLTLGMAGLGGAELNFKGDVNGAPVTAKVKTGLKDLFGIADFPFDADVTYGAIELTAKGDADIGGKKASISAYRISAGKTAINGNVNATWDGPRPRIKGALNSDHLDMADFKQAQTSDDENAPAAAKEAPTESGRRMFSDAPLPLAGLKAADAELDMAVGDFPLGRGDIKQISAKLVLNNGNLTIAPAHGTVGGVPIEVQLKLDASQSPARLTVGVIGNGIDLSDLQKLGSMTPFMTGRASANIQLTGEGDSAHAIASSLGGVIVITAEKGEILTGAAKDISSVLANVFNPQGGNAALNCLAARFNAKNGVLTDNGILIDSTPSTVAGKGNVNLALETVNLTLRANTKLVDIGGLVPAVLVNGTLKHPGYSVDAVGMVQNVVGQLAGGNLDVVSSTVPAMQSAPAGQNACVYTLDHPQAASAGSSILPANLAGKASQQIQNLSNSLTKGLFGK